MNELAFLQRLMKAMPSAAHLDVRRCAVLFTLAEQPAPIKFGDLARAAGVPKTALCRALDSLGKDGLTLRRHSGMDGRDAWISITDAGLALVQSVTTPVTVGDVFGLPREVYREPRTVAA